MGNRVTVSGASNFDANSHYILWASQGPGRSIDGYDIYGTSGNDIIFASDDLAIEWSPFNINFNKGEDQVFAGDGSDYVVGREQDDALYGEGGDDLLIGDLGADILHGGSGSDTVSYEFASGSLTLDLTNLDGGGASVGSGAAAGDRLFSIENILGTGFSDSISGDNYSNRLSGGGGNDYLFGGGNTDTLIGGAGADTLEGGTNFDTASYAHATGSVTIRLWNGTGENNIADGDVLVSIENVIGSAYNDGLVGADGVANRLEGGGGIDYLYGLTGNDVLIGGTGADFLDGGGGVDTASYADATGSVTVRLWNGTGENNVAEGDTLVSIENVIGSAYNDGLVGADGVANRLEGGGGIDYLYGLTGNDVLIGGTGADFLDGGGGVDTASYADATGSVTIRLWNGTGENNVAEGDTLVSIENVIGSAYNDGLVGANGVANRLDGGVGDDFLAGLTGDDTFVFRLGGDGDTIHDFIAGAGTDDRIELSGFGTAFDSFAEVVAAASQAGADTVINFGGGDTITLSGVTLTTLHQDDFLFA